jgi:hypothetical protein
MSGVDITESVQPEPDHPLPTDDDVEDLDPINPDDVPISDDKEGRMGTGDAS